MGVLRSIISMKFNLRDREMKLMSPGYAHNHADITYHMLNPRTKRIVLSHNVIRINKTYGEYVSRKQHTKYNSYTLQYEDEPNKWSYKKNCQD